MRVGDRLKRENVLSQPERSARPLTVRPAPVPCSRRPASCIGWCNLSAGTTPEVACFAKRSDRRSDPHGLSG
jgi:hypothetical protein